MGRRGVPVGDSARWVFNRLAEAYRHRPGYPRELVDRLVELAGGGPVADLGAGTGLLAVPLAVRGLEVYAVEPARAMLDVLADRARSAGAEVHAVHAAGEDTGLPDRSIRLAVIADALHWLDPELAGRELARMIAPAGRVAVIESLPAPTPFMDELESLFARFNPRAQRACVTNAIGQVMRLAGVGGEPSVETFTSQEHLEPQALEGVVRSFSFAGPALGEHRLRELLEGVREISARHGGATWSRVLRLTWAIRTR